MVIDFWTKPHNTKALPLHLEIEEMQKLFPCFAVKKKSANSVTWEGRLQVDETFPVYLLRIEYTRSRRPKVFILSPKIQNFKEKKIPHLYRKGKYNKADNLCLYLPKNKEFTYQNFIARTIIPWTSHWLFCYEIWKMTGTWVGGGAHPK